MSKGKDDSWIGWVLAAVGLGGLAWTAINSGSPVDVVTALPGLVTGDTEIVIGNSGPLVVRTVGNGQYMRSDAADAFTEMQAQALADGVTFWAGSAFRSMADQTQTYALYVARAFAPPKVLPPGQSNHGAGIAVDISSESNHPGQYCPSCIQQGDPAFAWLSTNAQTYGFSWTEGQSVGEPWHWDFVG